MAALPKGVRQRGASFVADVTVHGKRRTASANTLEEAILLKEQLMAGLSAQPDRS